jgi:6-phosphogluconolactonase
VPELVVVSDIAEEACKRFAEAAPRTIALAGGETPRAVYQGLATLDYDWSATEIFFGDERCVPPSDPASNYRMAWDSLLSKVPAAVHPMPGKACDAPSYARTIAQSFGAGMPRFDLVFLGLGTDGHTASLFPGSPALKESTRLVVAVTHPDHSRLTLTLPVLRAAKLVVFLVAGTSKQEALRQLLAGEDIPAAMVTAGRVVIIADESAAGRVG